MDRSNPFDALFEDAGHPTNPGYPTSTGRGSSGSRSGESNITEVHNDFQNHRPHPSTLTQHSDPFPISEFQGIPRIIERAPASTTATIDSRYQHLFSTTSTSTNHSSSNQRPYFPLTQLSISDDQTAGRPSSSQRIHLASSNSHHTSFPPSATGSLSLGSVQTQEIPTDRRTTQWHPPFTQQNQPTQRQSATHHESPPQRATSPGTTTLSSDPYLAIINAIQESNTTLHTAILAQQEALQQQQQTMAQQQQLLIQFMTTEANGRKEQTTILRKQLDAIITLATKPTTSHTVPERRVPSEHFQPSPEDGISIASTSNMVPPTTTSAPPNQLQQNLMPPAPTHTTDTQPDDASVTSVQSVVQAAQSGYQETKLNIVTFEESWLHKDTSQAKGWLRTIISELASKPHYHPLLTPDKKRINYNAPIEGANATLHSTLQTKLSSHFRTMMLNSNFTSGTQILHFIDSSLNTLRGNKTTASQALAEFYQLKWTPPKMDILTFNTSFNKVLSLVIETNPDFAFEQVKHAWIRALPDEFSDLQMKLNKSNLDAKWKAVMTVADLYVLTLEEMGNCNITFTKQDPSPKAVPEPKPATIKLCKNAPTTSRGPFPAEFPSFDKLLAEVKSMAESNQTKEAIEQKFLPAYPYRSSCWLCRIKPRKDGNHRHTTCPLLKTIFNSYPLIGTSRSFKAHHSNPTVIDANKNTTKLTSSPSTKPKVIMKVIPIRKQPPKKATSIEPHHTVTPKLMCYDTGTSPRSLCSHKEYFSDLIMFDTPRLVSLADPDLTSEVLGQGTLDIIINDQYRINLFAFYARSSDLLMSAVDHLSYKENEINGKNGKIHISYPTFTFSVSAANNFEFHVTPGKDSNKPILWSPTEEARINEIKLENELHIQRLSQEAVLPQRATIDATGYDISACTESTIPPKTTVTVPLGFKLSFASHLKCDLRPRSGLSLKGLQVALGTIDPDYRGELKAIVTNNTDEPFNIHYGQRIGQLVFSPVVHPTVKEVSYLDITKRGINGFGSTGTTKLPQAKRQAVHRPFHPVLRTIPEIPSKQQSTTTTTINPNDITVDEIEQITTEVTQYDVHDVTEEQAPKVVHDDAIHLFPESMYRQGTLNITGNSTQDKLASPQIQPISESDSDTENLTDSDSDSNSESSLNLSDATPDPTTVDPDLSPTDDTSDLSPTDTADDQHVHTVNSEGGSQSLQGGTPVPTVMIDAHSLYDDEVAPIPGPDTMQSPHQNQFTSILNDSTRAPPRIPPEDRVSSTEPVNKVVTTEYFQKCFGFRNIEPIVKHISTQSMNNLTIRDTGKHPILSRGETATIPKYKKNSNPVTKPNNYGSIWHYDIVYGNGRAIGGILYALFFVDRKSRHKIIIGLKDLEKPTLQRAIKKFIRKVGFYPDELIADRDFKIIGSHIDDILEPFTQVSGAPGGRQSQNGLSESNWRYICNIARNYLVEHLLPPEFWFFAISYAVQVSNYIPVKTATKSVTTPYFETYGKHPDYRKLIPLFSAAYVKIYESGEGNTLETQTIKAILVGNDTKSDGRLFYNPNTKKILASSDYRLNVSCPSGPIFNLQYQEPTSFSLFNNRVNDDAPTFDLHQTVYLSPTATQHPLAKATVIDIPFKPGEPYKLQIADNASIISVQAYDILPYNPQAVTANDTSPSIHYPWFKNKARCTIFLSESMAIPKHGIVVQENDTWKVHLGHSLTSKSKNKKQVILPLPSDIVELETLMESGHLIEGWHNSKSVLQTIENRKTFTYVARRVTFTHSTDPAELSNDNIQSQLDKLEQPEIIAFSRKVSAKNLSSPLEPKLHEHHKLNPTDKEIWDKSYLEEYMGLHEQTKTWDYITEEQYQALRPVVGNALPSMAISKIKTDENGTPDRAKYRIVVLGNLDPHDWSNRECFAPVLSSFELRLLIAIAVQNHVIPKSGDVSQAFVQSVLPESEKYVIKPPKGCPLTPSKTYLLLKKTLYGLKRSPRHWYNTCRQTLIDIGLKPCPNAPCIFTGTLIEGQPPLYLGLFVDDFIYFSANSEVERKFEQLFGAKFNVDFSPEVTHFLGIKFTNVTHPDGHIDIYLNQPKDIADLIKKAGLHHPQTLEVKTPYRSGHPVDTIPHVEMPNSEREKLNKTLQELVGCLNWLSTQTRPDIATITNILAQYNTKCSPGHIDAAKYAIRYLKSTPNLGIKFSSKNQTKIDSFVQFPLDPKKPQALTDANWGPQDQSVPKPDDKPVYLDLFKTRSIAGHVVWWGGPLDWVSKRQTYTARSSADAEVGSVDECTKALQGFVNVLKDLSLYESIINHEPLQIYNDNAATVQWSHNMTTKGLRYIQIRENAVRENVQANVITVNHIGGKLNPSDIFTKEDRDVDHFQQCVNALCSTPPPSFSSLSRASLEGGCYTSVRPTTA